MTDSSPEQLAIVQLDHLPQADLHPLLEESRRQGFRFLDRLASDYAAGVNRFEKTGEALFGVYVARQLVAIGGLNRDPYLIQDGVGRVRHLYVLDSWRNQGIGRYLVEHIIEYARTHFYLLTVRTLSEPAGAFYRSLGFRSEPAIENATYHLELRA